MGTYLPPHALEFRDLFAQAEHVLRRVGYLQADRKKAMVDWQQFADDLGQPFFETVRASGSAATLLREPPRAYYREGGWQPENQTPIANAVELFTRGVCQVRNNIEHGEKYILEEGPRSDALVQQSKWVLEEALKAHPASREYMKTHGGRF